MVLATQRITWGQVSGAGLGNTVGYRLLKSQPTPKNPSYLVSLYIQFGAVNVIWNILNWNIITVAKKAEFYDP